MAYCLSACSGSIGFSYFSLIRWLLQVTLNSNSFLTRFSTQVVFPGHPRFHFFYVFYNLLGCRNYKKNFSHNYFQHTNTMAMCWRYGRGSFPWNSPLKNKSQLWNEIDHKQVIQETYLEWIPLYTKESASKLTYWHTTLLHKCWWRCVSDVIKVC